MARDNIMRIYAAIFLYFFIIGKSHLIAAEDTVLFRETINADYREYEISQILNSSRTKSLIVPTGDSISKIISSQYGVGASHARAVYDKFENHIVATNQIADADSIKAGQELVIPDLPKIAKSNPSPDNKYNEIPRISIPTDIFDASNTGLTFETFATDSLVVNVFSDGNPAAKYVTQIRERTKDEFDKLEDFQNIDVISYPIDEIFFDGDLGLSSARTVVAEQEKNKIREWLSGEKNNDVILFILDDSWPSYEDYVESHNFILASIDLVRRNYMLDNLAHQKRKPLKVISDKEFKLSGSHSRKIKDAIIDYSSISQNSDRVKVIYLPLFVDQLGAKELFREIIELRELSASMNNNLGGMQPSKSQIKTAKSNADRVISILESKGKSSAIQPSDYAIIAAVYELLTLYSNSTKTPYLLNFSWTVPALTFNPTFRPGSLGLVISAAGNEGDSAYLLKRQFVSNSKYPRDVLAVMDIDATGKPTCCYARCSSTLDLSTDNFILGFNGTTKDGGCGTSFATPRVAWLLAQKVSMMPASKIRNVDPETWQVEFQKFVMRLRSFSDSDDGYNKIRLNSELLTTKNGD